jgi:hypothetical protein
MSAKIYTVQCTQAEFQKLPGLVARSVFMDWTGLSSDELSDEVKAGRIVVYRTDGYARYYKHEIARLTGFKM